jgi:hypothetical protein
LRKECLRPLAGVRGGLTRLRGPGAVSRDRSRVSGRFALVVAALVVALVTGFESWFRLSSPAFAQAAPAPPDANLKGAWSAVGTWPLIPVHMVLMPDGSVLSYGTDRTGRQTGMFIYDVWDSAVGLGGGHLTLPNGTGTDVFCSSQLVLPEGGSVFVAGGDNWTGTGTTNTGNNK